MEPASHHACSAPAACSACCGVLAYHNTFPLDEQTRVPGTCLTTPNTISGDGAPACLHLHGYSCHLPAAPGWVGTFPLHLVTFPWSGGDGRTMGSFCLPAMPPAKTSFLFAGGGATPAVLRCCIFSHLLFHAACHCLIGVGGLTPCLLYSPSHLGGSLPGGSKHLHFLGGTACQRQAPGAAPAAGTDCPGLSPAQACSACCTATQNPRNTPACFCYFPNTAPRTHFPYCLLEMGTCHHLPFIPRHLCQARHAITLPATCKRTFSQRHDDTFLPLPAPQAATCHLPPCHCTTGSAGRPGRWREAGHSGWAGAVSATCLPSSTTTITMEVTGGYLPTWRLGTPAKHVFGGYLPPGRHHASWEFLQNCTYHPSDRLTF